MYTICLPISVPNPTKKKPQRRWYLNLNQYRNTHFQTLNKAKEQFGEIVKPLLGSLPRLGRVNLIYDLYVGNHQLCDTSNICSIVDKFFSDVLVNEKKIEDDNYTVVLSALYRYGGLDKGNGHVKVTIQPVDPAGLQEDHDDQTTEREAPMRITLLQPDIEAAIRAYVTSGIGLAEGKAIEMKFSMKRGENGLQGEVSIVDAGSAGQASTGSAPVAVEDNSGSTEVQSESPAATTTAPNKSSKSSSIFGGSAAKPTNQPQAEPEVAQADA